MKAETGPRSIVTPIAYPRHRNMDVRSFEGIDEFGAPLSMPNGVWLATLRN
jgi:hypothetical protein